MTCHCRQKIHGCHIQQHSIMQSVQTYGKKIGICLDVVRSPLLVFGAIFKRGLFSGSTSSTKSVPTILLYSWEDGVHQLIGHSRVSFCLGIKRSPCANHVKKCSANRLILMQIILVHMKCFAQGLVLLQVQGNLEIVTGVLVFWAWN